MTDCPFDQALAKAAQPDFTLVGNPLARPLEDVVEQRRINRNLASLERDAARRNDPARGQSYSEIMSMRYGGAE